MTIPEPPQNIEAEQAVLGSILLNRDAIIAVASWLRPDYFYLQRHAQIYAAMLACYNRRVPPDARTVADELRRHNQLELIGGIIYLGQIIDALKTSQNLLEDVLCVFQKHHFYPFLSFFEAGLRLERRYLDQLPKISSTVLGYRCLGQKHVTPPSPTLDIFYMQAPCKKTSHHRVNTHPP